MYFKDKDNDDITLDFDNKKFDIKKFKLPLIILGIIVIIVIGIIFLTNKNNNLSSNIKTDYFLTLEGEELITIYKGNEYVEPGYSGKDSLGNDLTNKVVVFSNIDTSVIGDYEVVYTLNDKILTRYISVVDKPIGATSIYLIGDLTTYLDINSKYVEPGYMAIDSVDSTLTDKVIVKNEIDTSKVGTYYVIYSVTNSSGITIQNKRKVVVTDSEITLSLDNTNYTNKDINIEVYVSDNYFDYLILPNGNKINNRSYTYTVSSNGEYKFTSYNKNGKESTESITVSNIDKEKPQGTCYGSHANSKSNINIKASDNIGISRYVIDGISYTSSTITLNKEISKVSITIYDKAGNMNTISCNLEDKNIQDNGSSNSSSNSNSNSSSNSSNNSSSSSNSNSSSSSNSNSSNSSGSIDTPISKNKNVSVNYFTPTKGSSLAYWLYLPNKINKNLPIIVYLHSLGGKGNDYKNNTTLAITWGPIHEVLKFNYSYNAIIITPQVPSGKQVYNITDEIIELTNTIANKYSANKNKISLIGFSHGCYGGLNIIKENQRYFSAAVLIGCECNQSAKYYVNTPIWTFVGSGEGNSTMPSFVNEINKLGGNAKHTKVSYQEHNIINDTYSILRDDNYKVINWMISQTKK